MFDVNGLKQINDNLGHEKGDMLIQMGAKSLLYFKTDDISIYRMGGDEFVLKDLLGSEVCAERNAPHFNLMMRNNFLFL